MSDRTIKESEEKLKIFETELEKLNEDIEDMKIKIRIYQNKINEGHSEQEIMYLKMISSCYSDLPRKIFLIQSISGIILSVVKTFLKIVKK